MQSDRIYVSVRIASFLHDEQNSALAHRVCKMVAF